MTYFKDRNDKVCVRCGKEGHRSHACKSDLPDEMRHMYVFEFGSGRTRFGYEIEVKVQAPKATKVTGVTNSVSALAYNHSSTKDTS